MIALWTAGWIIMAVCVIVLVTLDLRPVRSERADDIRCAVDCAIVVALGCYAEGILFGLSGWGAL